MSKEFPIFDTTIIRSVGQENYNTLRIQFSSLADQKQREFINNFDSRFSDIDELIKEGCYSIFDYMQETADYAVNILNNNNIYNYDSARFLQDCTDAMNEWINAFEKIEDEYTDIVMDREEAAQYRAARKANRGRIVGGGFGLGGAMKGMAQAGAINFGIGTLHSAANFIGNGIDAIGASMKKSSLYSRCDEPLSEAVNRTVYRMLFPLIDILRNNGVAIDSLTVNDSNEAKAIFSNIKSGNIPQSVLKEQLINVIQLNPYNQDVYKYICDEFGDADNHIADISNHFGCSIYKYKLQYVENTVKSIDYLNEDELKSAYNKVDSVCSKYGFNSDKYKKAFDSILSMHDTMNRNFDGFLYDTREDANKAKTELESIINKVEGLSGNNQAEEMACIDELNQSSCATKDKYVDYLNSAIARAEERLTVVKGVKYPDKETAAKMRGEALELDSVFKDTQYTSLDMIDAKIEKISGLSIEIKEKYIKYLNIIKTLFEEQTRFYDEYKDIDLVDFNNRTKCYNAYTLAHTLVRAIFDVDIHNVLNKNSDISNRLDFSAGRKNTYIVNNEKFYDLYGKLRKTCLSIRNKNFSNITEAIEYFNEQISDAHKYVEYLEKKNTQKKGFFASIKNAFSDFWNSDLESSHKFITDDGKKPIPEPINKSAIIAENSAKYKHLIEKLEDIKYVFTISSDLEDETLSLRKLLIPTENLKAKDINSIVNKTLSAINNSSNYDKVYNVVLTQVGNDADAVAEEISNCASITKEEALTKIQDLPYIFFSTSDKEIADLVQMELDLCGAVAIIKES